MNSFKNLLSNNPASKHANKIFLLLACLCILVTYASFSVPLIFSWIDSVNFIYTNAWDEETYLSYQGAIGASSVPGYWFSAWCVILLQNLGLSGAEINLLFDTLLTPITCLILAKALREHGINGIQSYLYAFIILFAVVLFNFANPLFASVFSHTYGAWGHGFESYQSILRTPQPQLSLFILSAALLAHARSRNIIWLLLPLPFLYYFVAILYGYFLTAWLIYSHINRKTNSWPATLLAALLAYLLVATGFWILDQVFFSKLELIQNTKHYIKSHAFKLPVIFVYASLILTSQYLTTRRAYSKQATLLRLQVFLTLSILLMANIQIIAGTMMSYKNYYDYGINFLGGAVSAVFLHSLWLRFQVLPSLLCLTLLTLIAICSLNGYGYDFNKQEFRAFRGLQFNSEDTYKKVINNPTRALIVDLSVSSKLAYSSAKSLSPINSYLYAYPLISDQCAQVKATIDNAISQLKKTDNKDDKALLDELLKRQKAMLTRYKYFSDSEENSYCNINWGTGDYFTIPRDYRDNGWLKIGLTGRKN